VHERTTVNSSKEDVDEREDLLETVLLPGLLDAAAQIRENLDEIRTQIDKQRARVRELRVKKLVEPGV
jgi:elongator complex protein 1